MGSRGPLPKSGDGKVVGINARADISHRRPAGERPRPRPIAPDCPPWLDDYGKRVFRRLVRELEPLGLLNPTNREILIAYCEAASVNKSAWAALTPNRKRGPDVMTGGRHPNDPMVRAKAWGIVRESAKLLDQLGKSLLVTPASMLRAELPPGDSGDDESDLD